MNQFWVLMKESTIMQATLSLLVVGAYVYLVVSNTVVPPAFETLVGLVVGFFFGGKLGVATATTRNAQESMTAMVEQAAKPPKEDN
jgi:hypothetical protein